MQGRNTAFTVAIKGTVFLSLSLSLSLGGCTLLETQNPSTSPVATASPLASDQTGVPESSPAAPSQNSMGKSTASSRPPLTVEKLSNAEYYLFAKGPTQLANGKYEDKATGRSVKLGEVFSYGNLNNDGMKDAVAILNVTVPETGTFSYLVASVNDVGTPKNIAAQFLGNNLTVKQLSIQPDQKIEVVMQQGNADITRIYTLKYIKLPEK